MVGRVEWTTLSGDDVENLVAIMLLREFDNGIHIRPSRGDGGIDVYVPNSDRSSIEVYQIKKFSSNLNVTAKRQIEESVNRLASSSDRARYPISACHVTLPLNSTPENDKWLQGLESTYGIPLDWRGLSYLNGLAADHPKVVDHYVHGGRQFLLDEMASLIRLLRNTEQTIHDAREDSALQASQIRDHVAQLQTRLNDLDLFYTYDFEVGNHEPIFADRPGLIASISQRYSDGPYVTVHLYEKFRGAADFQPSEFVVRASPGTEAERRSFEDFIAYGLPAEVTAEFETRMPSGLGNESVMGTVSIGPTADSKSTAQVQRWEILDEQSRELAEVSMKVTPPIRGLTARGLSISGEELEGTFSAVWRFDGETLVLQIRPADLTGREVVEVQRGANFLAAMAPENFLRISRQYGPRSNMRQPLTGIDMASWGRVKRLIGDLAVIQSETATVIRFPDLDSMTSDNRAEITRAARLIRGEEIKATWGAVPLEITLHEGIDPALGSDPVTLAGLSDFQLRLGDDIIELGMVMLHYKAAKAAGPAYETSDGRRVVALEPAFDNNSVIIKRHIQD